MTGHFLSQYFQTSNAQVQQETLDGATQTTGLNEVLSVTQQKQ